MLQLKADSMLAVVYSTSYFKIQIPQTAIETLILSKGP